MASLELAGLSQVLLQQVPGTMQRLQQYVHELENRVVELEARVMSPYTFSGPPGAPRVFMTWRELAEERMEHHETRNLREEQATDLLENASAQTWTAITNRSITSTDLRQIQSLIIEARVALEGESEEEEEGAAS